MSINLNKTARDHLLPKNVACSKFITTEFTFQNQHRSLLSPSVFPDATSKQRRFNEVQTTKNLDVRSTTKPLRMLFTKGLNYQIRIVIKFIVISKIRSKHKI